MTTYVHTLVGFVPPARTDEPWTQARIEGAATIDGTPAAIETLALSPVDTDPAHPMARTLTTDNVPFPEGWLRVVFLDAGGQESAPSGLVQSPGNDYGTAFAEVTDVEARYGPLTEVQEGQAQAALNIVAGLIRTACDRDADWAPDPVPTLFFALSVEKAVGVVSNPQNLAATSEQLGSLQRSQTFPRSLDVGIFLTRSERREVRKAAGVAAITSVTLVSPYSGDVEVDDRDLWPLDEVWPGS